MHAPLPRRALLLLLACLAPLACVPTPDAGAEEAPKKADPLVIGTWPLQDEAVVDGDTIRVEGRRSIRHVVDGVGDLVILETPHHQLGMVRIVFDEEDGQGPSSPLEIQRRCHGESSFLERCPYPSTGRSPRPAPCGSPPGHVIAPLQSSTSSGAEATSARRRVIRPSTR